EAVATRGQLRAFRPARARGHWAAPPPPLDRQPRAPLGPRPAVPGPRLRGAPRVQEIRNRTLRVEDRLERLLAPGWRNAGAEAADLAGEADALAALGLERLAQRLRAVTAAPSVDEALPAIVLAAASCRLLRARLPAATAPPGPWAPLLAGEGLPRSPNVEL